MVLQAVPVEMNQKMKRIKGRLILSRSLIHLLMALFVEK
jgi:hypothetical protein